MTYQSGTVACIKVNGQILRETGDVVLLPFGSTYSVLIKNLNSVRVQAKVSIDGTDATECTHLVIPANGEIELERFIRNGNLNSGNKLRFIERTAGIESHRGITASDGIVRVEVWKEKIQPVIDVPIVRHHYYDRWHQLPYYYPSWPYHPPYTLTWGDGMLMKSTTTSTLGGEQFGTQTGNLNTANFTASNAASEIRSSGQQTNSTKSSRRSSGIGGSSLRSAAPARSMNAMFAMEQSINDAGITVPGEASDQRFNSVAGFALESASTVIILHLRGQVGKQAVAKAVTVKASKKCNTCGKANKGGGKCCSNCGTSLVLI